MAGDALYHYKLRSESDLSITTSNPYEPIDPEYDPADTITERIYLHVEPIHNNDSEEKPNPVRFAWTFTGQHDLAKAYHAVEIVDLNNKVKRDQIVAQRLAHLFR
jgi:hypothetical protein